MASSSLTLPDLHQEMDEESELEDEELEDEDLVEYRKAMSASIKTLIVSLTC